MANVEVTMDMDDKLVAAAKERFRKEHCLARGVRVRLDYQSSTDVSVKRTLL